MDLTAKFDHPTFSRSAMQKLLKSVKI